MSLLGWQDRLTKAEKEAVKQYLKELRSRFPEIARGAYPYPRRDTVIYVYADIADKETLEKVRETMLPIATDLSVRHRTIIVLMPKSVDLSAHSQKGQSRRKSKMSVQKHPAEVR